MSLRKKITSGLIGGAKKVLETARLKRKTYKPATHTTGPSGKPRKITGRHEKAKARTEAAKKTIQNRRTVGRVRAATATAGAVAGGVGSYVAGRRSGAGSNNNQGGPAAGTDKPSKPSKPKLPNPLSMQGRSAHNENAVIRAREKAAKKPQEPTSLKDAYANLSPAAKAALGSKKNPVKKAIKKVKGATRKAKEVAPKKKKLKKITYADVRAGRATAMQHTRYRNSQKK